MPKIISDIQKGKQAKKLTARWSLLAEEIRQIASDADGKGQLTQEQRRRVAVLVAREAIALGVDLPLSAVEIITGVWVDDATSEQEAVHTRDEACARTLAHPSR
ncbi:MAG: hypothetical protein KTR15_11650 [Phycisphaeraceae bacterium]|nr:hypothetical protein [Phycisphaeraceae bacterium]